MAPDKETKSPAVEAEEKTTKPDNVEKKTNLEQQTMDEDFETITIESEPKVENMTEKIEDQKVNEKKEIAEAVAEIIEKNVDDLVEKEAVPIVDKKKQDEPNVIEETIENDPIVSETKPVPADEIAMKKEADLKEKEEELSKAGCAKEIVGPIIIEEPPTDAKKDDDFVENAKQDTTETFKTKENTKDAIETKENATLELAKTTEMKDPEKPALEPAKNESKEEKTIDETKLTSSKEEVKTSPKQSYSLMGKVKKSFMKAKKVISIGGKSNSNTKNPETKEDEKASGRA
ncbi:hypothetical protein HanPI659440_Chr06g0243981 [Helianthus annuus]|nr:hypothetical protein HanPI659440_Chr06g0243981 [Helianthus annuus]